MNRQRDSLDLEIWAYEILNREIANNKKVVRTTMCYMGVPPTVKELNRITYFTATNSLTYKINTLIKKEKKLTSSILGKIKNFNKSLEMSYEIMAHQIALDLVVQKSNEMEELK